MLVDAADHEVGTAPKLDVHRPPGVLHRAFSVVLFDRAGQILLQRRADQKHHFAGLWSNTCCSHPRPGESLADAGRRRLAEELGIDAAVQPATRFVYRAVDPVSGLVEHELDHVLVGRYDGPVRPVTAEVCEVRWVNAARLARELRRNPQRFTPWLPLALAALEGA